MLVQDSPKYTERGWGYFLQFTENENSTVKLISIKKGESMHLQYHTKRNEYWFVVSGKIWIRNDEVSELLTPGRFATIHQGSIHKMEGVDDSMILEISKGLFDERDIVHLD